jgi:hypothetical protein
MKPTVGRQVHFHGSDTYWHRNIAASVASDAERKQARAYDGPFAATVVSVHPNGKVNLLICFPSPCYGSPEKTEIVENVSESDGPHEGCWTWPPRS